MPTEEKVEQSNTPDQDVKPDEAGLMVEGDESGGDKSESLDTDGKPEESEDKSSGDVGEGDKADAPQVPEKYELNFPDGIEMDESSLGDLTEKFKSNNFTGEQAQAVVDMHGEYLRNQAQAFADQRDAWRKEAEADPEYGGQNLKESQRLAGLAWQRFGSDDLKSLLTDSGLGNNLTFLRVWREVGKALDQDTHARGQSSSSKTPRTAEELFYGKVDAES